MRVRLTGNHGYIGTVLAPMLNNAGHDVVGLDNGLFRECSIATVPHVPTLRKDIRDVEAEDLEGSMPSSASTCSVYGAAGDALLDERSSFNPVTTYAESKMRSCAGSRASRQQ